MDTSLYKRMGVSDGRVANPHLYGMPENWKRTSGAERTKSEKTCIKHGTVKDGPNMTYRAAGGSCRTKAGAGGSIFRDSMVDPNMSPLFGRKRASKRAKAAAAENMPAAEMSKGGKACREKLAVGAVAKIRKNQY